MQDPGAVGDGVPAGRLTFRTLWGGPSPEAGLIEELARIKQRVRTASFSYDFDLFLMIGGDITRGGRAVASPQTRGLSVVDVCFEESAEAVGQPDDSESVVVDELDGPACRHPDRVACPVVGEHHAIDEVSEIVACASRELPSTRSSGMRWVYSATRPWCQPPYAEPEEGHSSVRVPWRRYPRIRRRPRSSLIELAPSIVMS